MRVTPSQYALVLEALLSEKKKEEREIIIKKFIGYVSRERQQKKFPAILKHFEKLENERTGRLPVTAMIAHAISAAVEKKIRHKAESLFPDKKIALAFVVDQAVLGGVRLQTEEVLYDATLAAQLKILKQQLLGA